MAVQYSVCCSGLRVGCSTEGWRQLLNGSVLNWRIRYPNFDMQVYSTRFVLATGWCTHVNANPPCNDCIQYSVSLCVIQVLRCHSPGTVSGLVWRHWLLFSHTKFVKVFLLASLSIIHIKHRSG